MKAFSALRVLVVDDQPMINEFCRKVLEHLGCAQVFSALNGHEAIEILTRKPDINLVLTDISMSPGNGLELLQAIRCGDIPRLPRDLCVLMFTDYNYRHNVMSAIGLDCHAFISKPINAALLSEKIDEARRRKIALASIETYRNIATAVSTKAEAGLAPAASANTGVDTSSLPHPSPPRPVPKTGISSHLLSEPGSSEQIQQAIDELTPESTRSAFLQHKQQQLTTILHYLKRIRREISLDNNADALQLTQQVEQISASLFEQEYHHQREHHYDQLPAHQAEHGMILQRTQTLANKIRQHKAPRAQQAHQQLLQAWYHHLSGKDQQYARHLAALEQLS